MFIYTGYFAHLKKYQENDLFPISIARKPPEFFNGFGYRSYEPLFPSESLLRDFKNNKVSVEKYIERYAKETLEILDIDKVVEELRQISSYRNIVLLCYEAPNYFCHRFIVSSWLVQNEFWCEEYYI